MNCAIGKTKNTPMKNPSHSFNSDLFFESIIKELKKDASIKNFYKIRDELCLDNESISYILKKLIKEEYKDYIKNTIIQGSDGSYHLNSNKSFFYNSKGVLLFFQNKYFEAQNAFTMAISLFPRYYQAMENLYYTIEFQKNDIIK